MNIFATFWRGLKLTFHWKNIVMVVGLLILGWIVMAIMAIAAVHAVNGLVWSIKAFPKFWGFLDHHFIAVLVGSFAAMLIWMIYTTGKAHNE